MSALRVSVGHSHVESRCCVAHTRRMERDEDVVQREVRGGGGDPQCPEHALDPPPQVPCRLELGPQNRCGGVGGEAARQVVDDRRAEGHGQQQPSNDPRNNQHNRGTPAAVRVAQGYAMLARESGGVIDWSPQHAAHTHRACGNPPCQGTIAGGDPLQRAPR